MTSREGGTLDQMNVPRAVARNTGVQLIGRAMSVLLSLGSLMILTRYLGTEGVGDYLLVLAILALLNIGNMGLFTIATRELAAGQTSPDVLMGNAVLTSVALALASMVLAISIGILLNY